MQYIGPDGCSQWLVLLRRLASHAQKQRTRPGVHWNQYPAACWCAPCRHSQHCLCGCIYVGVVQRAPKRQVQGLPWSVSCREGNDHLLSVVATRSVLGRTGGGEVGIGVLRDWSGRYVRPGPSLQTTSRQYTRTYIYIHTHIYIYTTTTQIASFWCSLELQLQVAPAWRCSVSC